MQYLIFLILILNSLCAAEGNLSVHVPKTAYIQWLSGPSEAMTKSGDSEIKFSLSPLAKRSQELYLGVMCNSLNGYNISFIAAHAKGAKSAEARSLSGKSIGYLVDLRPVNSSILGSAKTCLDLRGQVPSLSVSFTNENQLPMDAHRANVWRLLAKLKEKDLSLDEYYASITVVISLP